MGGKAVLAGTLAGGMRRWNFRSAAERKRGGIKSSRGFSRNREPARKPLSELDLTRCGAQPARQCHAPVRAGSLLAGLIGSPFCRISKCSVGLFSGPRSEEHTSELPSLMRISYAVFCLKKKQQN